MAKMKSRNDMLELLKALDSDLPRKLVVARTARVASRMKNKSMAAVKSAISNALSFADESDEGSVSGDDSTEDLDGHEKDG